MGTVTVAVLVTMAGVFGASAAGKLGGRAAYRRYRSGMADTTLIGSRLIGPVSALLVAAEVLIATGALIAVAMLAARVPAGPGTALGVSVAGLLLITVLTAGVAVTVRRSTGAGCACFGGTPTRPLGRLHLIRNGVLCLAAALGVVAAATSGPSGRAADLVAVLPGAVLAVLIARAEDVADLFATPAPPAGPVASARPSTPASPVTPARTASGVRGTLR